MTITAHIVDDEPAILETIRKALEKEAFGVRTYATAEAFLEQAQHDDPHVLVVDKNLPGMSGLDLVERQLDHGVTFQAILLTGHADLNSAIDAVRLGLYSYLRKPFELEDLVQDVHGAAERLGKPSDTGEERALLARIGEPVTQAGSELREVLAALEEADRVSPNMHDQLGEASQRLQTVEELIEAHCIEELARRASGGLSLHPVDLTAQVRDAMAARAELARERRSPIWFESSCDPVVLAHHVLLRKLLDQLLGIALRGCCSQQPLLLDVEQGDEHAVVHVIVQGSEVGALRKQDPGRLQLCNTVAVLVGGKLALTPYLGDTGVDLSLTLRLAHVAG